MEAYFKFYVYEGLLAKGLIAKSVIKFCWERNLHLDVTDDGGWFTRTTFFKISGTRKEIDDTQAILLPWLKEIT